MAGLGRGARSAPSGHPCYHPRRAFRGGFQVQPWEPDGNAAELLGGVAERSMAADCKSAGQRPTEVRILPPPPIESTS
jgi:hypothetical protein